MQNISSNTTITTGSTNYNLTNRSTLTVSAIGNPGYFHICTAYVTLPGPGGEQENVSQQITPSLYANSLYNGGIVGNGNVLYEDQPNLPFPAGCSSNKSGNSCVPCAQGTPSKACSPPNMTMPAQMNFPDYPNGIWDSGTNSFTLSTIYDCTNTVAAIPPSTVQRSIGFAMNHTGETIFQGVSYKGLLQSGALSFGTVSITPSSSIFTADAALSPQSKISIKNSSLVIYNGNNQVTQGISGNSDATLIVSGANLTMHIPASQTVHFKGTLHLGTNSQILITGGGTWDITKATIATPITTSYGTGQYVIIPSS